MQKRSAGRARGRVGEEVSSVAARAAQKSKGQGQMPTETAAQERGPSRGRRGVSQMSAPASAVLFQPLRKPPPHRP